MNKYIPQRVRELCAYTAGENIYKIKLDANESAYELPQSVKTSIAAGIVSTAQSRYPDPLCRDVCRRYGELLGIPPENITAGNGSDELISVITDCFLGTSKKLLCFAPDFSMYSFYAELRGTEVIIKEKNPDFVLTADEIIRCARECKPDVIMLSNPCNPTGSGLRAEEVLKACDECDAVVVCDEAYMEFWNQSVVAQACKRDNLVVLRTCSKALAMAGVRLGFAIACDEITNALRKVKSPYNVSALTQIAFLSAYENADFIVANAFALTENRKKLAERLSQISAVRVYPSKANFLLIETAFADLIYEKLLENSVIVRRFKGNRLRISAGTAEQTDLIAEIIGKAVSDI